VHAPPQPIGSGEVNAPDHPIPHHNNGFANIGA
jgi:hypothetical protein